MFFFSRFVKLWEIDSTQFIRHVHYNYNLCVLYRTANIIIAVIQTTDVSENMSKTSLLFNKTNSILICYNNYRRSDGYASVIWLYDKFTVTDKEETELNLETISSRRSHISKMHFSVT